MPFNTKLKHFNSWNSSISCFGRREKKTGSGRTGRRILISHRTQAGAWASRARVGLGPIFRPLQSSKRIMIKWIMNRVIPEKKKLWYIFAISPTPTQSFCVTSRLGLPSYKDFFVLHVIFFPRHKVSFQLNFFSFFAEQSLVHQNVY